MEEEQYQEWAVDSSFLFEFWYLMILRLMIMLRIAAVDNIGGWIGTEQ
jgi:hypothetical protein